MCSDKAEANDRKRGDEVMMKLVYESNNVFSDPVTIEIRQQLDDGGTFLVLEHTDCSAEYKADHPDRYRVMSLAELIEFESERVRLSA